MRILQKKTDNKMKIISIDLSEKKKRNDMQSGEVQ